MARAILLLPFPLQITRSTSYEGNSSSSYCRWRELQGRGRRTQSVSAISAIDYSQKRSLFSILNKELSFLPVQGTSSSCFDWPAPQHFKPFSALAHLAQDPGSLLDTNADCVVSLICVFCASSSILLRASAQIRLKELWKKADRACCRDHLPQNRRQAQIQLLGICLRLQTSYPPCNLNSSTSTKSAESLLSH